MSIIRYKERWVCFSCRKMSRVLSRVKDARPGVKTDDQTRVCPECGAEMDNVGSFFAPPPRGERRRWEAASLVAAAGYHCHSLGASVMFWELVGPGRPNLREVRSRLACAVVQSSEGRRLLESVERKRRSSSRRAAT